MIALNEQEHKEKKYPFPAFDFLFRNTGTAAALIWKYRVVVLEAEIDQRPELKFSAAVKNERLIIQVMDNGWGRSRQYRAEIAEDRLNRLFSQDNRTFSGIIAGGDNKEIISLSISDANLADFDTLLQAQRAAQEEQKQKYIQLWGDKDRYHERELNPLPENPNALIISSDKGGYFVALNSVSPSVLTLTACWQCLEDEYSGEDRVSQSYTIIALTENGFLQSYPNDTCGAILNSDTIYAAIIDPSQGPHEREYFISRSIPACDVDRFHILIGATMSCRLKVNVDFFLDDNIVINGKESLVLNIWNPRNKEYQKRYKDGEEIHLF